MCCRQHGRTRLCHDDQLEQHAALYDDVEPDDDHHHGQSADDQHVHEQHDRLDNDNRHIVDDNHDVPRDHDDCDVLEHYQLSEHDHEQPHEHERNRSQYNHEHDEDARPPDDHDPAVS